VSAFFERRMKMMEEVILQTRFNKIQEFFEEGTWEWFFEEHPYIEKVMFFGSFMKGKNHEGSDIDIICIPKAEVLAELSAEERIEYVLGLHMDLSDQLATDISIDVKLQEATIGEDQFGLSYHTGDWVCIDYAFAKGQIGQYAMIQSGLDVTFGSC